MPEVSNEELPIGTKLVLVGYSTDGSWDMDGFCDIDGFWENDVPLKIDCSVSNRPVEPELLGRVLYLTCEKLEARQVDSGGLSGSLTAKWSPTTQSYEVVGTYTACVRNEVTHRKSIRLPGNEPITIWKEVEVRWFYAMLRVPPRCD